MEIKTSIAQTKDTDAIAEIYHECSLFHQNNLPHIFKPTKLEIDLEYIKENINQEYVKIIKAEIDGVICGYLVLYSKDYPEQFFVEKEVGFIGSIGVSKKYQKLGVAKELLKHAEEFLKEQGIHTIEVDYYSFNKIAGSLYESAGYVEEKRFLTKKI